MNNEIPVTSAPENTGSEIWKVFRFQLLVFAIYEFVFAMACQTGFMHTFLLMIFIPISFHCLALFIFMILNFAKKKKGAALGYLISLLVIGIVSFPISFLISSIIRNG